MTYHIVTRSQHAAKGRAGFAGPDHYAAIVSVPEGVAFDPRSTPLSLRTLKSKGIAVRFVGEYYGRFEGPRSKQHAVLSQARAIVAAMSLEQAPGASECLDAVVPVARPTSYAYPFAA